MFVPCLKRNYRAMASSTGQVTPDSTYLFTTLAVPHQQTGAVPWTDRKIETDPR